MASSSPLLDFDRRDAIAGRALGSDYGCVEEDVNVVIRHDLVED
jgi:hypothetical protein